MTRRLIILVALGLAAATPPADAAARGCASRLWPPPPLSPARMISARDLIELRDFGPLDNSLAVEPFSVSPDGRSVALILRRADTDRDRYCFGVLLVPIGRPDRARLIDIGGEFIQSANDIRGVPAVESGAPRALPPVWSPDGRRIAYLRRDGGETRAWTVGLDGRPARPAATLGTDALAVRWASDGKRLVVTIRPALDAGRRAIDREGKSGFRFDARFWTLSEARPAPGLPLERMEVALDPSSGHATPVRASPPPGPLAAVTPNGRAWVAQDDPQHPWSAASLHVVWRGTPRPCAAAICGDRIGALWWQPDGSLFFLRGGSADDGGRTALYRWQPDTEAAPVLVRDTDDALFGCQPVALVLICAHESALAPRTIVRLDPATGHWATLLDPNPGFAGVRLGRVRRLLWTAADGIRSYGDLVLPPDDHGKPHPLVVVQYTSRGFLRGGTGDAYPIQLLAAHGFAVLSVQRPGLLAGADKVHDLEELQRLNIANWAERRTIVASLEAGVDKVIALGVADPQRIGLTGLSDGATTTQFALNHSNRFSAAAISSCCDEPSGLFVAGLAYGAATLSWGYPGTAGSRDAFWAPMSLAAHAAGWRVPLLIQVPDREYRLGLETISAFDRERAPVDAYVFPDEHHLTWHPAHRLAIYERSVAWFDFWLQGRTDQSSARAGEMARWEAMKARLERASAVPAGVR